MLDGSKDPPSKEKDVFCVLFLRGGHFKFGGNREAIVWVSFSLSVDEIISGHSNYHLTICHSYSNTRIDTAIFAA